jgi:hypothetical protein
VLIVFAYGARFDSAAHKRLIIVASTALMTAPITRWHLHGFLRTGEFGVGATMAERLSYIFILLLMPTICGQRAVAMAMCEGSRNKVLV